MKETEFAKFAHSIGLSEGALDNIVYGLASRSRWSFIRRELIHDSRGQFALTRKQMAAINEWVKGPGKKYVEAEE